MDLTDNKLEQLSYAVNLYCELNGIRKQARHVWWPGSDSILYEGYLVIDYDPRGEPRARLIIDKAPGDAILKHSVIDLVRAIRLDMSLRRRAYESLKTHDWAVFLNPITHKFNN